MSEQVGEFTMYVEEHPRRYQIGKADPVVDISSELLADIRRANGHAPTVTISNHPGRGEVITFADDYGRVAVYVVDPVQPTPDTYRMRWVD